MSSGSRSNYEPTDRPLATFRVLTLPAEGRRRRTGAFRSCSGPCGSGGGVFAERRLERRADSVVVPLLVERVARDGAEFRGRGDLRMGVFRPASQRIARIMEPTQLGLAVRHRRRVALHHGFPGRDFNSPSGTGRLVRPVGGSPSGRRCSPAGRIRGGRSQVVGRDVRSRSADSGTRHIPNGLSRNAQPDSPLPHGRTGNAITSG